MNKCFIFSVGWRYTQSFRDHRTRQASDENCRVNSFTCPLIRTVWTCMIFDMCRIEMYTNSQMIQRTFNPKLLFRNKVLSAACMPSRRVPWTSNSQLVYPEGIHGLVLSLFAVIQQVVCV
jgi:hypothetical protein